MNKILIIAIFTLGFIKSYSQTITYTPQTAAGYQFKYIKADSGLSIPLIDTSLRRGVNKIGAIVARPQDSLLYYWTGSKWSKVSQDVSSLLALINTKVDSVTVLGDELRYWVNGVSTMYSLSTIAGTLNSVTTNGNTTANTISVGKLISGSDITVYQDNSSQVLANFITAFNSPFDTLNRSYLRGDSINNNNNYYLPDTTGTFVLSVNGQRANKKGEITIAAGGGTFDTTTIYNNLALKLNVSDTAAMLNDYVNDAGNGLQKLSNKSIGLGGAITTPTTITRNSQFWMYGVGGQSSGILLDNSQAIIGDVRHSTTLALLRVNGNAVDVDNISSNATFGINTNGGNTASLDVNGTVRFRNGSGLNKIWVSDATGIGSWQTKNWLEPSDISAASPILWDDGAREITADTSTANYALVTNFRLDSAKNRIQSNINTTNVQVTANTTAITQRVTYANLTDSLNQISLSKNGANDSTILQVNGRRFAAVDNGSIANGIDSVLAVGQLLTNDREINLNDNEFKLKGGSTNVVGLRFTGDGKSILGDIEALNKRSVFTVDGFGNTASFSNIDNTTRFGVNGFSGLNTTLEVNGSIGSNSSVRFTGLIQNSLDTTNNKILVIGNDGTLKKSHWQSGGGSGLTYPYTTNKYVNGYGDFPALNADSITNGTTNKFTQWTTSGSNISYTSGNAIVTNGYVEAGTSSGFPVRYGGNGSVGGYIHGGSSGIAFPLSTSVVATDGTGSPTIGTIDIGQDPTYRFNRVFANTALFSGTADNYFAAKVGIGTPSPSTTLHVNGTVRLQTGNEGASKILQSDATGNADWVSFVAGTNYEVPLTFSTGLTRSTNTITVNASQNISTLSNLTTNGYVKTSGGTGLLSIATTIPQADVTNLTTDLMGGLISNKSSNYTCTNSDNVINATTASITITLPTAVGNDGKEFTIINSTSGNITVNTTSSQLIGNFTTATAYTLASDKSVTVKSDNSNYKIKTSD